MKRENLKLLAIIIVGLLIYLTFFIEKVEDKPVDNGVQTTPDNSKSKKDTVLVKDIKTKQ